MHPELHVCTSSALSIFCNVAKNLAMSTVQAFFLFSKRHQNYFHVKFAVNCLGVMLSFQGIRPGVTENGTSL